MSVVSVIMRELMALGVEGDALVAAVDRIANAVEIDKAKSVDEAVEKASLRADRELAERKAKAVERTRKWRETRAANAAVISPNVTERHTSSPNVTPPCVGAQVVTPSLPSLRSEELKTKEPSGSSVDASTPAIPEKPKTKPPKADRGTRLSPDWEPSAEEFDLARSEGLTDEEIHRAALEFRNYWCARSRDAARLSWRLTWHNRVIEIGDRKRRDAARLVARPAFGGGGGRGVEDFASIVARRRGFVAN